MKRAFITYAVVTEDCEQLDKDELGLGGWCQKICFTTGWNIDELFYIERSHWGL